MNTILKRFIFNNNLVIASVAFGVLVCLLLVWHEQRHLVITLPLAGGIVSFIYFIQQQHLQEVRLFKELFHEFNSRYDDLNEKMTAIAADSISAPLEDKQNDTLNKYFNLCGEEYLFYKKGFIDLEAWKAWNNGMRCFLSNERIWNKWLKEGDTDSYYGLSFDHLKPSVHGRAATHEKRSMVSASI